MLFNNDLSNNDLFFMYFNDNTWTSTIFLSRNNDFPINDFIILYINDFDVHFCIPLVRIFACDKMTLELVKVETSSMEPTRSSPPSSRSKSS